MERSRRFNRNLSNESNRSINLQKKLAESRRPVAKPEPVPDLTDFMNDMFFGTPTATANKAYNLTGGDTRDIFLDDDDDDGFDDSVRSNSSRLTQDWLDEAKRMVASSPTRTDSPSKLVVSPRFANSQARPSLASLDRRDPQSRSARRHRSAAGSFSGEILAKSERHNRNKSETFDHLTTAAVDTSRSAAVHRWVSDVISPPSRTPSPPTSRTDEIPVATGPNPAPLPLPPRLSGPRKSRFQNSITYATQPQGIPINVSKRTFRTSSIDSPPAPDSKPLSPPKTLNVSAHRRSSSSTTCSLPENKILSPPRGLVESVHRRSISSSTCSVDNNLYKPSANKETTETIDGGQNDELNGFLKEKRIKVWQILDGEINGTAKIVLSGPSNSTSSMVAAICYAWLLENRMKTNKEGSGKDSGTVVVPVMNMRRSKMWEHRQVAWLFHHINLDAKALLFSDEVDLETLMMSKQLSILVVGQDILRTNGEVGSQCTVLTDNYCEDAYDLLQTPILKKLLLAGIVLDTLNLNMSGKVSMTRDAEAVQLLSVGSTPNYRNVLFDQLMQDQEDERFNDVLRNNYGKSPKKSSHDREGRTDNRNHDGKISKEATVLKSDKYRNDVNSAKTRMISPMSAKPKPAPTQVPPAASEQATNGSRGKSKSFLSKWFGFGSK